MQTNARQGDNEKILEGFSLIEDLSVGTRLYKPNKSKYLYLFVSGYLDNENGQILIKQLKYCIEKNNQFLVIVFSKKQQFWDDFSIERIIMDIEKKDACLIFIFPIGANIKSDIINKCSLGTFILDDKALLLSNSDDENLEIWIRTKMDKRILRIY